MTEDERREKIERGFCPDCGSDLVKNACLKCCVIYTLYKGKYVKNGLGFNDLCMIIDNLVQNQKKIMASNKLHDIYHTRFC
jgi:hypothetical protein